MNRTTLPHLVQSIHLMADPKHPETLFLKQKYEKLRGKISSIYAQGDFLEITLNQISHLDVILVYGLGVPHIAHRLIAA